MGIFSKLNKKIEDGPEIDDVEAWLAGDDETPAEPMNRSTDVAAEERSDDSVDVAAAIGPLATTGAPLTASELIAAAPPADMDMPPAASAPAPAMWNMPDIAEPDVQWDAPLPEPVAEEAPDPASSGVTTADLAAMVADSNRASAKPPELSEPMSFDDAGASFGDAGFDAQSLQAETFEPEAPSFETESFETASFETASFETEAPSFETETFQTGAPSFETETFEAESLVSFDSSEALFETAETAEAAEVAEVAEATMPPPPAGEMLAPADSFEMSDAAFATPESDSVVPDWASADLGETVETETVETETVEPLSVQTAAVEVENQPETIELDALDATGGPEHAETGSFLASMPQGEQAEVLLEILGLEAGATWAEAREARAALLAEHNPDGETDPDRVALAHAIRREMNTAYAALRLLQVP